MDNVVVVPTDPDQNKKYKSDMEKAKRLILDGVKDHIVLHISGKNTTKEIGRPWLCCTKELPSSRRCTWSRRSG